MVFGNVEDDRPCLEQDEIGFLVGRNLTERVERQMRGLLHRSKRNRPDFIGLAHFLERPANARIARQSPAAIGRPFKGGNGDGHRVLTLVNRPRRSRAGVPPARAVAGERRLLARVDATRDRHAERADGVPDRRDDRVGEA